MSIQDLYKERLSIMRELMYFNDSHDKYEDGLKRLQEIDKELKELARIKGISRPPNKYGTNI